eukprot:CAMPEP_0181488126 /NCGR_PEP_ID=MMETSP1110-20121109/48217_1 /TAXON_ID=174948 /ORGANISM="Symbiodinium sp., Strain CCMP421" /LENGTH=157 /DNA_ID=CAMNT_0023614741 /DNA_START=459 /DNA_END=930 /DNA_ORIENTATION=+
MPNGSVQEGAPVAFRDLSEDHSAVLGEDVLALVARVLKEILPLVGGGIRILVHRLEAALHLGELAAAIEPPVLMANILPRAWSFVGSSHDLVDAAGIAASVLGKGSMRHPLRMPGVTNAVAGHCIVLLSGTGAEEDFSIGLAEDNSAAAHAAQLEPK